MQTRTASARLNLARAVLVALYVVSLLLPVAAEPPNAIGAVHWWRGYMVLVIGPLAILDLQFAWLGNPLLVVALIKPNRVVSALLAVVVAFALGWHTIPTGPDFKPIHAFGIGYYLWLAAMVGAAALPWIGGRGNRDAVAPATGIVPDSPVDPMDAIDPMDAMDAAAPAGAGDAAQPGTAPSPPLSPIPPNRWVVTTTDTRIEAIDPKGTTHGIALADLGAVVIETNDQGPYESDVWWILFDTNKQFACGFPQNADGVKAAVDRLLDLPGIDHRKVIDAQTSVQNAMFPIWQRAAQAEPKDGEAQRTD
ncbi:hypothetical protein BLA13014_06678 [Burkholderia aenigmatica]|uniref:Transmembrane protein n=1 Tax=Burkholderia aenigmatica TaxID=2015348 RepID=A0A6P2S5G2_9BURK|nr:MULTISPECIES: hypothetical protein [Burkholderia]VWC38073.1 hypothetical protein BLA13014_06678 [Burkholderia aenigmatica]